MHKRLKEDNEPISAKSAAQILSLNLLLSETFLLSNFLITSLCNSWANTLFTVAPDPVFLSKNLYTPLANPLFYPSYLRFIAIS